MDIVLVHGSFHGGWCFDPMRLGLMASGHRVFTPSQTGAAERCHLLSDSITMETYVLDIVNQFEAEELSGVILAGHSFGMRTVMGVADRMPERIAHLVALDGAFPTSGVSRLEGLPAEEREARIESAVAHDGGLSVPPPPATKFGLTDPQEVAWVSRRMTPMPLSVEASRLELRNPVGNGLPGTYVRFTKPAFGNLAPSVAIARERLGWNYVEISSNHDAIISESAAVCDIINGIADRIGRCAQAPSKDETDV